MTSARTGQFVFSSGNSSSKIRKKRNIRIKASDGIINGNPPKNNPQKQYVTKIMTVSCMFCKKEFISSDSFLRHDYSHIWVPCKLCGLSVIMTKMESHFSKSHSSSHKKVVIPKQSKNVFSKKLPAKLINISVSTQRTPTDNKYIRCPQCDLLILKTRLTDHMEHHKANIDIASKAKTQSSYRSWAKVNAKPTNRTSAKYEGESKKQDATYGHHSILESGRFGSHPSHDNYDDESRS